VRPWWLSATLAITCLAPVRSWSALSNFWPSLFFFYAALVGSQQLLAITFSLPCGPGRLSATFGGPGRLPATPARPWPTPSNFCVLNSGLKRILKKYQLNKYCPFQQRKYLLLALKINLRTRGTFWNFATHTNTTHTHNTHTHTHTHTHARTHTHIQNTGPPYEHRPAVRTQARHTNTGLLYEHRPTTTKAFAFKSENQFGDPWRFFRFRTLGIWSEQILLKSREFSAGIHRQFDHAKTSRILGWNCRDQRKPREFSAQINLSTSRSSFVDVWALPCGPGRLPATPVRLWPTPSNFCIFAHLCVFFQPRFETIHFLALVKHPEPKISIITKRELLKKLLIAEDSPNKHNPI
jgi:hypothetical protein